MKNEAGFAGHLLSRRDAPFTEVFWSKVHFTEVFWSKVHFTDNGCWVWTGRTDPRGYGRLGLKLLHRIIYRETKGCPDGMFVCHSCDNPPCINPDHLWLGTAGDNARDMAAKGRTRGQASSACARGHEFTETNTYRKPDGSRRCRACNLLARGRYLAKRKAP